MEEEQEKEQEIIPLVGYDLDIENASKEEQEEYVRGYLESLKY